jgi:hypothetical protein
MTMAVDPEILRRLQMARAPKPKKEKKPMNQVSEKKKEEVKKEKESGESKALVAYFDYHMAHSEPVCEECGMEAKWLLDPQYKDLWKACQAHCLPKKKTHGFPSVASTLENHLVLFPSWGGHLCGCHGFYDSSWFNASTMKVWPKASEIITAKLIHLLTDSERKRLPEVIKKLINQ